MITRRQLLVSTPAAVLGTALASKAASLAAAPLNDARVLDQGAPAAGPFTLPPLGYAVDALEPHIDAQTMTIHHDKHHAAYVNNLNAAVASHADLKQKSVEDLIKGLGAVPDDIRTAVRNNAGGHYNHTLFWKSLKKGGGTPPAGDLAKGITAAFGSFDKMKDQLTAAAMGVFGSGWAWLSADNTGRLVIEATPNQDSPLMRDHTPLLGIDVWEHAYYLKYQNLRKDYVTAIFNVIDWDTVQQRFK